VMKSNKLYFFLFLARLHEVRVCGRNLLITAYSFERVLLFITQNKDIYNKDKLRFKDHCDYMLKKIGKKTSFLNRIGNYILAYTRYIVYKAIIALHFEIVQRC